MAEEWAAGVALRMIELAIEDWRDGVAHPMHLSRSKRGREARDWIMNPGRQANIKFEDACAIVNIEPEILRARIRRHVEG
jgi:hypothetical protein